MGGERGWGRLAIDRAARFSVLSLFLWLFAFTNVVQASSSSSTFVGSQAKWSLPEGSTALVTGGTKGIGRAIVSELASTLGCTVLTCGRNKEELDACIEECNKSEGGTVYGIVADVSTVEGRQVLMDAIRDKLGNRLDILVNNVGTNIRKPTIEYTEQDFDFIMATNLKSMFELSKLCQPLLAKSSGGASVVNIGSVAGVTCIKTGTPYSMTKAAMNQLTGNLACEWGPHGIRVNCVTPWYINTPLAKQVLKNEAYKAYVL
jgi:Tropinone reductase 1